MPTLATARELAATFSTDGDITPWQRVQQYRQVADYTDRHPDQGSTAVATALDLPASRVKSWVYQGSKPNPVHAIDTAHEYDWLDLHPDSEDAKPWVELVAWIYSGGTIRSNMLHPSFYVDDTIDILPDPPLDSLKTSLNDIGVGVEISTRDDGKPREIRVRDDPILVGRMLTAMGAPVGEKRDNDQLRLPTWLFEADQQTQRVFARLYIQNQGSTQDSEQSSIRFFVGWADDFNQDLARLFREASGLNDDDDVTLTSHMLKLSPDAVDAILADD